MELGSIPCQRLLVIVIQDPDDSHLLRCSVCHHGGSRDNVVELNHDRENLTPDSNNDNYNDNPLDSSGVITNPPTRFGLRKDNKTNSRSKKGKRNHTPHNLQAFANRQTTLNAIPSSISGRARASVQQIQERCQYSNRYGNFSIARLLVARRRG